MTFEPTTPSSFNVKPLAAEQEEAVRQAMRGFVLPDSAIPTWATNVTDTELAMMLKDKVDKKT